MKFILSLLLMPSVMGDFQKLTDMSTMGKCSKINSVKDKYLLLYTVPYSDSEADVEKFLLYPDETPLLASLFFLSHYVFSGNFQLTPLSFLRISVKQLSGRLA